MLGHTYNSKYTIYFYKQLLYKQQYSEEIFILKQI